MKIGLHPLWLDSDPNGGIATYWSALIEELGRLDADNRYTVYYNHPEALARSVNYRPAHIGARIVRPASRWLEIPVGLPLEIMRRRVDLLHTQTLAPPICPVPFIQVLNDLAWETNPEVYPTRVLFRLRRLVPGSSRRALRIITVSEYSKGLICEHYGIPEDRVHVTPHGVTGHYRPITEPQRLADLRKHYNLPGPYLLYVGKLQSRKNLARLIEAFKKGVIKAGLPHDLVLIGARTWMSDEIFDAIKRCRVEDRVKVLGEVSLDDLPAFYSAADLFVFPSLAEGFGLPPLEAMSCGTAVVCSSASSLPEVVGDAGLQIDPYDVDALAEAIVSVLTDDRLRSDLEAKGLERSRLFSNERMARLTLEVYAAAKADLA